MFRKELAAKIYPVDELAAKRLFTIPMLDIRVADTDLSCAFVWMTAPYGHDFWSAVYQKLGALR